MIFGLEKKKLERLKNRIAELSELNEKTLTQLNEIFKEYVQIVKKLHSKEPNIFANIHRYGLAELKSHKDYIRKNADQENFDGFKYAIESSIDDSLLYMKDYLHV